MKKVLAIDMGATSIRGILGSIQDGRIVLEEVMRFPHRIIKTEGGLRWQWEDLMQVIRETIDRYEDQISSVGIDTWGVDFGLLDEAGNLIEPPLSYRNPDNTIGFEKMKEALSEEEIFVRTGSQVMEINTLFQLATIREKRPETYGKIKKILMLPDLVQYLLTGRMVGEETIWSTSQMMDLRTRQMSRDMADLLGLSPELFPELVRAGSLTGKVRDKEVDVVCVCGHDTACAVLMTRVMKEEDCLFLSCGTWSLFGARIPASLQEERVYRAGMANELGYDSSNLLLKNITGLFLLEKYKQQLEEERGEKLPFTVITEKVSASFAESPEPGPVLDLEDPAFAKEDMVAQREIDAYLTARGLDLPNGEMEYFRLIYDSLVEKYIETRRLLEEVTGRNYKKLHMIGGGARSSLLCQRIADRLGLEITAGPFEASALGNILIQLKAIGACDSMEEVLQHQLLVEEDICSYHPRRLTR